MENEMDTILGFLRSCAIKAMEVDDLKSYTNFVGAIQQAKRAFEEKNYKELAPMVLFLEQKKGGHFPLLHKKIGF